MIRNRYNRVPHPALNTKRERDTYNEDGTKIKTAQVKSQGDSSFPTESHTAIQNKLNSKSKTNRKRTNIDSYNKPQQKHRLGTVSNKLLTINEWHKTLTNGKNGILWSIPWTLTTSAICLTYIFTNKIIWKGYPLEIAESLLSWNGCFEHFSKYAFLFRMSALEIVFADMWFAFMVW